MSSPSKNEVAAPSPTPQSILEQEDDSGTSATVPSTKRSRSSDAESEENLKTSISRIIPSFTRQRKRLRRDAPYSAAYQDLFNSFHQDCRERFRETNEEVYDVSYVGLSEWTGAEKNAFFRALDLCGRDNVRAIAVQVQSKTETEVEAYIELLQEAEGQLRLDKTTEEPYIGEDHSVACELTPYCEDQLEDVADGLAVRELRKEKRDERFRYRGAWLLDQDVASYISQGTFDVEKYLESQGLESTQEQRAVELLDVNMMLDLSVNYFMNPEDDEWNYRTYASAEERPSIRLSALVDLAMLVERFTRRLILTAFHCTRSRINATLSIRSALRPAERPTKPKCDRTDVSAAIKILQATNPGLRENSREFWTSIRRNLSKEDQEELAGFEAVLEKKMKQNRTKLQDKEWQTLLRGPAPSIESPQEVEEESRYSSSEDSERDSSSTDDDRPDLDEHDMYLEALDARVARQEEMRLLRICESSAPEDTLEDNDDTTLDPRPMKDPEGNAKDWRKSIGYQSLWERYSEPPPETAFQPEISESQKQTEDVPELSSVRVGRSPESDSASDDGNDSAPSPHYEHDNMGSSEGTAIKDGVQRRSARGRLSSARRLSGDSAESSLELTMTIESDNDT